MTTNKENVVEAVLMNYVEQLQKSADMLRMFCDAVEQRTKLEQDANHEGEADG